MQYLFLIGFSLAAPSGAYAQANLTKTSQEILREGVTLYQLERASWVSTDLLQARGFPTLQVSSYFSYVAADSVRTLFVGSPGPAPQVMAEYRYPLHTIRPATARAAGTRPLLPRERALLAVRQQSLADLGRIPGTELLGKASFNAVLVPKGAQTWVYVLTAATRPGVTLLGNDYLLRYDAAGRLLGSQKMHPGVIPVRRPATPTDVRATLHAHLAGASPFITPTDICTLLLYRSQFRGPSHVVLSKKYASIFSFADARLTIIPRREFERMQPR